MKKWIKIFGSLAFALWLLGGLVTILTLSTLLESAHGTPFAQRFFYQAGWFDVFLALLGLNILCSALSRWPYKKYHTGFLIVHLGILMLLAGSFLSRYQGVDGQISLFEGESGNKILLPGYELIAHLPDHSVKFLPLDKPSRAVGVVIAHVDPDVDITLKKVVTNATVVESTEEGGPDTPANAGIEFTIKSKMAGANQRVALFQHHPSNPTPNILALGAATFELNDTAPMADEENTAEPVTKPRLRIVKKDTGEVFVWDLDPLPTRDLPLGSTGIVIKNLRYLPDARVDDSNKLVSVSKDPLNPAVEFDAVDRMGQRETHTRFELFPDFESLHGRTKNDLLHLEVDLKTPGIKTDQSKKNTGLQFFVKNGKWAYHSHSSKIPDQEGFLDLHKETPAGWMDFTFTVERFYSHAQILKKITETSADVQGEKSDIALLIAAKKNGQEVSTDWVLPSESLRLTMPQGPLILALRQRSAPIPFSLTLKDFRKMDYPGTSEASSYESDVVLNDTAEGIQMEKTIRMNQPLDYKGYRIFQSSFSQDPENGESSVFTVAKNPGIKLIYMGSIVMCLGIITVFYIKPLSSFSAKEKPRVSKKH